MKSLLPFISLFLLIAFTGCSQTNPEAEKEVLHQLLNDFLEGASINDAEMHDRFWSDDLIYTSSSGQRYGKETIMDGMSNSGGTSENPSTIYTSEDVDIKIFENTAVVAFRLVSTTTTEEGESVSNFLNSGTFVKRNGEWRSINWQATRMAE